MGWGNIVNSLNSAFDSSLLKPNEAELLLDESISRNIAFNYHPATDNPQKWYFCY